ncbi:MAG TPA: 1-deoxy-D-xylulose-5-phosphate reductoisomerase [Candidatus Limnocylindrales bacterium]
MAPSADRPTRVALLGSTGSIGRQALDVLAGLGDAFEVVAMAAGHDKGLFAEQIATVRPRVVTLADQAALKTLDLPAGTIADADPDAMLTMAVRDDVEMVIVATGGVVSLRPVLAALAAGKVVATANKETLVAGGHLVMPLARALAQHVEDEAGPGDSMASALAWLRPIDSEHSAIWQCLLGERMDAVARLILTASGGPFRTARAASLAGVTPADALAHPTWRMGAKITIDSATLMNKGLEVVEAHWLYDCDYDRIDVVVHPQSVIHSAVEFVDGSVKAQLGLPDMRIPIQYALTHPRRFASPAPRLALTDLSALTFEPADEARFPALRIAREAGLAGPRATASLIAADEVAVQRFLDGTLGFTGIPRLVEAAIERFGSGSPAEPDVDGLIALDADVRAWAAAAPGGAS